MPDIIVHVHTQGGDTHQVKTPSDIKIDEFIRQLVTDLNLPNLDAEGGRVAWTIDDKDTGKTLDDQKTLEDAGVQSAHRLYLRRQVTAGNSMSVTPSDPRTRRLELERDRLIALNRECGYVKVKPVEERAGGPPERYRVQFDCRGIAGIDSSQNPIYATQHEVEIYCHADFPAEVPWLRWETPIWHPNIEHAEPKNVCVNKAQWRAGMGLDDLCQQMFEMVQYKNYHATLTHPYPIDEEAAKWVLEVAEPRGIVNKKRGVYVDDLPFYKTVTTGKTGNRVHRIIVHTSSGQTPPSHKIKVTTTSHKIKVHSEPASRPAEPELVAETNPEALPECASCGRRIPASSRYCTACGGKGAAGLKT